MNIEDTTFNNAIDASNAAMALAPAEYFEGDQQALKDILFPPGARVNQLFEQMAFKTISSEGNGIVKDLYYGIPLSITKVQSESTDNFQLLVLNMAVLGVDQPVPIVIGKVENDINLLIINGYENKKLTDNPISSTSSGDFRGIQEIGFFKGLFGKPVVLTAVIYFNSEKYSRDTRWPGDPVVIELKEYLFRRIESVRNQLSVNIGGNWPTPPFKSNSGWINWALDQYSAGYDFDGYIIDSLNVINK